MFRTSKSFSFSRQEIKRCTSAANTASTHLTVRHHLSAILEIAAIHTFTRMMRKNVSTLRLGHGRQTQIHTYRVPLKGTGSHELFCAPNIPHWTGSPFQHRNYYSTKEHRAHVAHLKGTLRKVAVRKALENKKCGPRRGGKILRSPGAA